MAGLATVAGTSGRVNAQDATADTGLEEVTITGSRIRDTGMNTPVPVTMVSAEQLGQAAPGNLIEAFDQMPQFMGNSSPGTDVFIGTNAGQSILNMRGLGAEPHAGAARWPARRAVHEATARWTSTCCPSR